MPTSTLSDLLRRAGAGLAGGMRVAIPGEVVTYDHARQKASVRPLVSRAYADGLVDDAPIIEGVPVIWPRSGGASLTFPVQAGDGVLILWCDIDIERWLQFGGSQPAADLRQHDWNDAVCVPGLYSFAEPSLSENNDDVLLIHGGSTVRLRGNGDIEIDAAGDVLLGPAGDRKKVLRDGDLCHVGSGSSAGQWPVYASTEKVWSG
ncbi:Gp138 family membrane-puncturing spike protein [Marinibaculum pumilum]|uniref:Gp138 family membrane-puncturing spike protein n=1 Tax=Marinibaculum pumilum TaxID=1766165 RepID=A0ABV7KYS7_9PROT